MRALPLVFFHWLVDLTGTQQIGDRREFDQFVPICLDPMAPSCSFPQFDLCFEVTNFLFKLRKKSRCGDKCPAGVTGSGGRWTVHRLGFEAIAVGEADSVEIGAYIR